MTLGGGTVNWCSALALACIVACAPDADFSYADGSSGHYADWRGRWVVLNYWAEWCEPCRAEIPELNALNKETEGHGVLVVGVNFDGLEGDGLAALVEKMQIEYPVTGTDPRKHFGYDLPSVLPTTVIIDPEGRVAATLVGPQTRKSLEEALGISAS
jgi:thiol-disulfide isomerase/thioredoxin